LVDAEDVRRAKVCLGEFIPDIILLDWMLPGCSGIDFLAWLKAQEPYKEIPIIMLTAKAEEENKIAGLSKGADDYVTKPFSPKELTARIKAVLRRRGSVVSPEDQIKFKELVLSASSNQVKVNENTIDLTSTEYKLLACFLKSPDKTLTRDQLITKVWGLNAYIDDRTVDASIKRLRTKLKPYDYDAIIKTIRGIGYQFDKKI